MVMGLQNVWSCNKKAILAYVPYGKNLKLIWQTDPKTETIIAKFRPLGDLATADSMSFSFDGTKMTFKVLNIASKNIQQFQERVRALPDLVP